MINRKLILITLIFIILSCVLIACGNSAQHADKDLAPMFELNDLDGQTVSLEKLAGQKVYIKYWASWCSICLAGLEDLNELATQDNDFEIITIVSPDYNGEMNQADFVTWFNELGYEHITVLLDPDGVWSRKFGVAAYPSSYYIDSASQLIKNILGHNPNDIIKSEMNKIN